VTPDALNGLAASHDPLPTTRMELLSDAPTVCVHVSVVTLVPLEPVFRESMVGTYAVVRVATVVRATRYDNAPANASIRASSGTEPNRVDGAGFPCLSFPPPFNVGRGERIGLLLGGPMPTSHHRRARNPD
jgi:hypothetical protein